MKKLVSVVAVVIAACETPPAAPTPQEVSALLSTAYVHPERHAVSARDGASPELVSWKRTFDGIDVLNEPKSVLLESGRWETRLIPELQEPPLPQSEKLLSIAQSVEALGLTQGVKEGTATARYVYQPVFIDKPNKAQVINAADVDRFIEKYILAIEVVDEASKTTTFVDAYTGAVLSRRSREMTLETQGEVEVYSLNYGYVSLQMADQRIGKGTKYVYKDLDRCTTTTTTIPPSCKNGQGVASPAFLNLAQPIPYDLLNYSANVRNDLYLGLQLTWDYFLAVHGRRGLSNLQPSAFHWVPNDAIGRLCVQGSCSFASADVNATMDPGSGILTLYLSGDNARDKKAAEMGSIGHEWAHGVYASEAQQNINPNGFYFGEEGGINEASSDLFGKLVEAYGLNRLGWQNDATIRSWNIVSRNMCTPSLDGHSYDEWFQGIDDASQDPHYTSGPVNRVHCLMARGLRVFGTSFAEPGLQSGRVPSPGFAGIGSESTGKIWYRTLSKLKVHTRPIKFMQARRDEILAAQELFGLYSPEYKAVEDAWAAVNVGPKAERTPPDVTLTTPGPFSRGMAIEVSATDADGVKSVTFKLGPLPPVTLTAPPWRYVPVTDLSDGLQTLQVTATDNKNTSKTYDFQIYTDFHGPGVVISDVTPCQTPSWPCPFWRMKRRFEVSATDISGVSQLELVVGGTVVATFAGTSTVFEHTFPAGGVYDVRGRARDTLGQVNEMVVPYVRIDTSPPIINYGPVITESTTDDGRVTWDLCAVDSNGVVLLAYSKLYVDGVAVFVNNVVYNNNHCVKMTSGALAKGNHTYTLHVFDGYENAAVRSGSFTVARIPPAMTTPTVAVDTVNIGRIVVSTTVTAQYGVSRIEWRAMPVVSGSPVVVITYPQSPNDNLRTYSQALTGLVPGATYVATVTVFGNNGVTLSKSSSSFTIPNGVSPPPPVVHYESEPNDIDDAYCNIPPANVLPSNVARIQGTYHPKPYYYASYLYTDSDVFRMTLPLGKTLHITSTFDCDDGGQNGISAAEVSVWRFSPSDGSSCSLGQLAAFTEAHGSVALDVGAQTSFGSNQVMIVVQYPRTYAGQSCSTPGYVLNVSVN